MARFRNKKASACICSVLFSVITSFLIIFALRMDAVTELVDENAQIKSIRSEKLLSTSLTGCGQEEAFTYIPSTTACKWAQMEFLIVFGALSVDNDGRQRRRNLQRTTCWAFPGVATRVNDYNGSMLVLYVLARHPSHGFAYSKSLILEAEQWHDVLTFPMDEGRVTTNKTIGGDGHWGIEAEIGMGRKTFFWLQLALRAFPRTIHVGKCDDDMFMQVPQYLADLRLLPQRGTYWGAYVGIKMLKNKQMERMYLNFMIGYGVALARDAAEAIVSYEPLRRIVTLPYSKERELDFCVLSVHREDIMIARILKETGYPVVIVAEKPGCRFHYSGGGSLSRNVSEHSVVVNHVREHEYYSYMSYFVEKGINIQSTIFDKRSPTLYWVKCPIK